MICADRLCQNTKHHHSWQTKKRLEELRQLINDECISYGEVAELESLAKYIDRDDVQLLQWAGVPENK